MAMRDAVTRAARRVGNAGSPQGDFARGINVGGAERAFSLMGGAVLGLYGLGRIRLGGVLLAGLGGALVYRGLTGHCRLYRALGIDRSSTVTGETKGNRGIKIERHVVLQTPADTVYRIWRNFENLPRFMSHLERVRTLDDRRSRWTIRVPARVGAPVEWDAEIVNDVPGEVIAWQTTGRAPVDHAGSVRFERIGGSSTRVVVELQYDPPAGEVGHMLAGLFGQDAGSQIEKDLTEFKRAVEAGEITATGMATRQHASS
jgi:uncharacterized membrane protein